MSEEAELEVPTVEGVEEMEDIIDILNDDEDEDEDGNPDVSLDEDEGSSSEEEQQLRQDAYSGKVFDLIDSLCNREVPVANEWDNDDDTGYITINLNEDEFFEFENRNLTRMFAEKAGRSPGHSVPQSPQQPSLEQPSPAAKATPLSAQERSASSSSRSSSSLGEGEFGEVLARAMKSANDLEAPEVPLPAADEHYVSAHRDPFQYVPDDINNVMALNARRQSVGERRRSEIIGQHRFDGADGGLHCYFNMKVIFEPYKTGFEESKDFKHTKGTVIAGRYEVYDVLGTAAFSTALQCIDMAADTESNESEWVCLKVIKNNKDFFDQSLDEIKLLQYINSRGDPDAHYVLRLIDYFYYKEHLFIVSELLKENLYEFGRYIRENNLEIYYTLPRLKRIAKQVLLALDFIHNLKLIHCDVKPENIVIKSFSRCEVKLIDFGSSCFTTDHLTTYIQSRSYRAPEVILGHNYDGRIDVWSVGAVVAELYTNYVLFQNDSVPTMLSRITGILGPFPASMLANCKDASKYFTANNIVYERDETSNSYQLVFPKKTNLHARLHMPAAQPGSLAGDEDLFVDFVRRLLDLDCTTRPTTAQALQHPWLADADTVQFTEYVIGQPRRDVDADGNTYDQDEEYEEDDELDGYDDEDEGEGYDTVPDAFTQLEPGVYEPFEDESGASTPNKYGRDGGSDYDAGSEDGAGDEAAEAIAALGVETAPEEERPESLAQNGSSGSESNNEAST